MNRFIDKISLHPTICLSFVLLFSFAECSGQTDTTRNDHSFTILEQYANGDLRLIGQFATNCADDILRKHGYFITFDQEGNETRKELYFFGNKRNRTFLGLKHGWWGWYGKTEKYFLGIRTRQPVIVDPCF